jgi:peptidyl-dipeptidase A
MRYFLAHIQQFQFHKALCDAAGYEGPLHRCTIYNSKKAGERLNAMMEMGSSKPWPEAMNALTGQPELDASAILTYFEPLQKWLDKQNEGRQCGW